MTTHIGIDNGLSGAVARLDANLQASVVPLPVVNKALDADSFAAILRAEQALGRIIAMVERPAIIQKTGRMSILRTGVCFGQICGVLAALRVPYEIVAAQQWKRVVLAGTDRSKEAAVARAQALFPQASLLRGPKSRKPDHNLAEALLIAEYCRRIHGSARDAQEQ